MFLNFPPQNIFDFINFFILMFFVMLAFYLLGQWLHSVFDKSKLEGLANKLTGYGDAIADKSYKDMKQLIKMVRKVSYRAFDKDK
ncbi:hypothetical protein [Enterovibrio sp. 27052020O]|uniref:hypothetical protein n=1 Tax=Enterovibrio sp. 27052020O TaxID=3241166 RepID=UPI0038911654